MSQAHPPRAQPFLVDRSGARYPIGESRWAGDDGSPLMVSALAGIGRGDIDNRTRSHWRYRRALPTVIAREVSLGEGCTPLVTARIGEVSLRVKLEWFNPTASFKDRGVSVMLSLLAGQGVEAVLEDSSGNGGSSVAAYAAASGLAATILAPESTSAAKIQQTRLHGARVELVPGSRAATAAEAVRRSADVFYASHNWHPFFLQGVKLIAYEIWEDLGFRAPDNVVVPAGAGSLVLGCSLGFGELLGAGQIERMPRLLVAQPVNCSPLAVAFAAGAFSVEPGEWERTIAEGVSIAEPVRAPEVLDAVARCGGDFQTVTEDEIRAATLSLVRMGPYAEPTSAVAAAAVPKLVARGTLDPAQETVLILTGSGLKAAESMRALTP